MTANLIAYWSHSENKRHNRVVEAETERANRVREEETMRHNLVTERETQRSNVARETETHRANVAYETELYRHNLAGETETNRHNLVTERETTRHNKAQEGIGWANVSLGYAQLAEQRRHNQVAETQQAEYNAAYLAYQRDVLAQRSVESDRSFLTDVGELGYKYGSLQETNRHNTVMEGIDQQNADTRQTTESWKLLLGASSELRQWVK